MDHDRNIFQDRSWMADMLDLVARKAPQFMKVGHGSGGSSFERRKAVERRPYSAAEKTQILELAKSGTVSAVEIGKRLGRNPTRIRDILKSEGVDIPDFRKKFSDIQRDQIVAMAQAGMCSSDIARKLKRNQASIREVLIGMGIKPCDGRLLGRNRKAA